MAHPAAGLTQLPIAVNQETTDSQEWRIALTNDAIRLRVHIDPAASGEVFLRKPGGRLPIRRHESGAFHLLVDDREKVRVEVWEIVDGDNVFRGTFEKPANYGIQDLHATLPGRWIDLSGADQGGPISVSLVCAEASEADAVNVKTLVRGEVRERVWAPDQARLMITRVGDHNDTRRYELTPTTTHIVLEAR